MVLDNGTVEAPTLSCGVPETLVKLAGLDRDWVGADTLPERRDAELPYDTSYVTRPSGVRLVTSNCLLCHASKLGGRLVIGLADVSRDFTQPDPLSGLSGLGLRAVAAALLNSEEQKELGRILRVVDVMSAYPRPDTIGLNPADAMFGGLASHRDLETLRWNDRVDPEAGPVPTRIIFTDVPAWWITGQKRGLFYTGFGRGDHARVMMTSALLCVEDSAEAARIDAYFPDVQAFISTLRAPRYEDLAQRSVDSARAERGASLYRQGCQRCHGGRRGEESEALELVPLAELGTDPVYAEVTAAGSDLPEAQTISYFFEFINRSWYGSHAPAARLERPSKLGYVPPSLEGVWATAPYFHNGSVPTLDAVLDPALRPRIFKRSFDSDAYDFERLGWPYSEVAQKGSDTAVYDTTRLGNSNRGHDFSSELSSEARRDLLEYLKTL
jgi:mono/diheme cytochrome c family protein